MPIYLYKIENGIISQCHDLPGWKVWFNSEQAIHDKKIKFTNLPNIRMCVSTVFSGICTSFENKKPLLFETVSIELEDDNTPDILECTKHATKEEAIKYHDFLVEKIMKEHNIISDHDTFPTLKHFRP